MRRLILSKLALICAAGLALPALAGAQTAPDATMQPVTQTTADGQVVTYQPAYFAEFQVSTAFDMVLRVPGFVFDGGESARGFSGTAGNVLIDGQRPATKADLGNTLSNINAAQVDHLELITGGAPGIDMHGHRQIVNVVRKKDAKSSLSLLAIVRNMDGRDTKGVLLFTYNANHDNKATDVTADIFTFFDNGANRARRLTTDSSGTQVMQIHQKAGGAGMESQASHSRPLLGGKITFNGTYNPSIYRYDATYVDSQTATELLFDKDTPSELGSQYERKFSHGFDLNLNVLDRHDREHVLDTYNDSSGTSDYRSLRLSNEHILNGRISWQKQDGLLFSLGSESAFNSLDETSSFVMNTSSQNVPTTSVRVEEDRTESFASVNWKATPKLSFEGEVKVENSTISVPQDHRSDSFTYLKPRFEAVYTIDDKTKLSWKTVRQVDQLSFNGFASTVQLQTNQVTLGNTALVPQKDWLNTLILERSFWDKGAISIAYEHYDYEDTSDFIALIDGSDVYSAVGNLGKGTADYLHIKVDTPLDKLHVPHGTLSIDATNRQTKVKDPITGRNRQISGMERWVYQASFSQEFPASRTSWGIDVQELNQDRNYLANELDDSHFDPWTQFWFQYKTPKNVTFKIMLKNPLNLRFTQDRTVYQGLRDQTPVVMTQHTTSHIPPIIELRLKKDF